MKRVIWYVNMVNNYFRSIVYNFKKDYIIDICDMYIFVNGII